MLSEEDMNCHLLELSIYQFHLTPKLVDEIIIINSQHGPVKEAYLSKPTKLSTFVNCYSRKTNVRHTYGPI